MDPVRLAVVGAGTIGRKHLQVIAEEPAATLVAIADPAAAARALADEYGVRHFTDAGSLLKETRPAGVIVATPTEHHLAPALAALDAGAHLLIEKPIAATLDEARQIAATARAAGRRVLVGHHRRYYALVHKAREIVQGGTLGQLVGVTGQWTALKAESYFAPAWRRGRLAGPVLTNLIHELDTLRYVCGEISSVAAETAGQVRGHEKEETAALTMRFADGALGSFLMSDAAPSPWTWEQATGENPAFPPAGRNVYRFMGSEAALEFPNLKIWRHRPGEESWNHTLESDEIALPLGDAFASQCAHFCAVIRGREEPRITAEDATGTLAATLAVFTAMESGRRVML